MMFSIKDFFSECDQIRIKLQIWSHLLKKSLMENFIFCAVQFACFESLTKLSIMLFMTYLVSIRTHSIFTKTDF